MAPLNEVLIERLFGEWLQDIDSEPFAHEAEWPVEASVERAA